MARKIRFTSIKNLIGGKKMSKVFRKFYNDIALDPELYGSAIKLYAILLALANFSTREITIYIGTLAEKLNRSPSTVRRHLTTLINLGLVERITRKSPHNARMNLANLFIVHDIDAGRYATSGDNPIFDSTPSQKLTVPPRKNGRQIQEGFELEVLREITINREAQLPEKVKDESLSSNGNSEGIPDIMKTTAEYWLFKTGKKSLSNHEVEVLRELLNNHTPVRIQKEIDKAVTRFIRDGKDPSKQSFGYIGKALSKQKSYDTDKKHSTQTKVQEVQPVQPKQEIEVSELPMTVETAETIIAEYAPNMTAEKQSEPLPLALVDLFAKLQAKQKECNADNWTCCATEVDRAVKNGEPMADIEFKSPTMEDYLHMKFPEAEEEELHRDYSGHVHEDYSDFPRGHLLEDAFEIDYACAMCDTPDKCILPAGYKSKSSNRPVVNMVANENGEKHLEVDYNGCVMCKHGAKVNTRSKYEFEDKIRYSGLSSNQANKTFIAFNHESASAEIIVAKAQAILAVQNNTNLILAGKPGTGKTHLAIAIALEAMRSGRKAIVKSLPELLDEICCAYQDHADPFGLMMKYKSVPCLVLDDWGKEKTSEARLDYLFQIIDYRYRNGLQTIITTNALNVEGLKNRWNADKIEPLVSRILENGKWVTIHNSENYRMKNSVEPEASQTVEPKEELPSVEVDSVAEDETFSENEFNFAESEMQDYEIFPEEQSESPADNPEALVETSAARKSWDEISESAEYQAMSEYDKVLAKWKYFRESPEYEAMSLFNRQAVQMAFFRMLSEADKRQEQMLREQTEMSSESVSKQAGYVITVPVHDDGLEDDEGL